MGASRLSAPGGAAADVWTDLPEWWRCTDQGWTPIGFIRYSQMQKVRGGYSGLLKHIFHMMFLGRENLDIGIAVPDGDGRLTAIKSTISAMIQDEKAHKECYGVKGAGGNSCCAA
eukprot:5745117-Pyramimonas_sp.AAC.1